MWWCKLKGSYDCMLLQLIYWKGYLKMLAYIRAKFGVTGYVDPSEVRYDFCPNLPHRVDRLEEKFEMNFITSENLDRYLCLDGGQNTNSQCGEMVFMCGNNRGEAAECCIATRTSSQLMMTPLRHSYDRSR